MTTDPKEAAIQRMADLYSAERQRMFHEGYSWKQFHEDCARIAIEQGVVPACKQSTVRISIDGEYAPGQYTAEIEIDWNAVCAGEKP